MRKRMLFNFAQAHAAGCVLVLHQLGKQHFKRGPARLREEVQVSADRSLMRLISAMGAVSARYSRRLPWKCGGDRKAASWSMCLKEVQRLETKIDPLALAVVLLLTSLTPDTP